MIISASIEIYAPMTLVWEVFTDIRQWREWNPVCRECRFETGKAMQAGACISFTLNPLFVPIRIAPVVNFLEQGRKVVWSGGRFGIHAEHTFVFKQTDASSVIIDSTEVFSGFMLVPAKIFGLPARLHTLSIRLLEAIKAEAEMRFQQRGNPPSTGRAKTSGRPAVSKDRSKN
jgi:hypothetical protein